MLTHNADGQPPAGPGLPAGAQRGQAAPTSQLHSKRYARSRFRERSCRGWQGSEVDEVDGGRAVAADAVVTGPFDPVAVVAGTFDHGWIGARCPAEPRLS